MKLTISWLKAEVGKMANLCFRMKRRRLTSSRPTPYKDEVGEPNDLFPSHRFVCMLLVSSCLQFSLQTTLRVKTGSALVNPAGLQTTWRRSSLFSRLSFDDTISCTCTGARHWGVLVFQSEGWWMLTSLSSLKLLKFDLESCLQLLAEAGLKSLGWIQDLYEKLHAPVVYLFITWSNRIFVF